MPDNFAEHHCIDHSGNMTCIQNLKKVTGKLEEDMKRKVGWQMFMWVVGGLAAAAVTVAIIQMNVSMGNSEKLNDLKVIVTQQGAELKGDIQRQSDCIERLTATATSNMNRINTIEGRIGGGK